MTRRAAYILAILIFGAAYTAAAQEVLRPARIQAKALRKQPSLGLPRRLDGQADGAVWYGSLVWQGADSMKADPFWTMAQVSEATDRGVLTPVFKLCATWASENPKQAVDVVWGPVPGGWFVAICKKTRSELGWKSIGFVVPAGGMQEGKGLWAYSRSVNWIEHQIGYNLFPKLPAHLQEIIEEMTASELLAPFQEFDPGLNERPDREIDYDWEEDYRDMG